MNSSYVTELLVIEACSEMSVLTDVNPLSCHLNSLYSDALRPVNLPFAPCNTVDHCTIKRTLAFPT